MSRPPFLKPSDGVRAYSLATRRGAFAVLDAPVAPGGGRPMGTALLVPGYTGSKEDFIALLGPLAEAGYRAVAVDGRGQYETPGDAARHVYGLGALAEDVLAQAEAMVAEPGVGPVHLVGHSLGGLIARGAVLRAVRRGEAPFASLTLIGSGPGRVSFWPRWRLRALNAGLPLLGPHRVWSVWHLGQRERDATTRWLRQRWLASAAMQARVTGRTLRYEPDRVARLAAVGLPVHVLSGERDGVWPLPLLDRMALRLNARRTVIRGAEHSPNAEAPQATAEALIDFWRTEAAVPSALDSDPARETTIRRP